MIELLAMRPCAATNWTEEDRAIIRDQPGSVLRMVRHDASDAVLMYALTDDRADEQKRIQAAIALLPRP